MCLPLKACVVLSYFLLFLSAFTSATLLPGSSEVMLLALLATTPSNAWVLVIIATAGNVLGSMVNWAMGRYFAHFRNRSWFPIKPAILRRAEHWYNRYGIWLLLLSWLPVVGDPLTVVAGSLRVGFWRFLAIVTVGKLARYGFIAVAFLWWSDTGASQPL